MVLRRIFLTFSFGQSSEKKKEGILNETFYKIKLLQGFSFCFHKKKMIVNYDTTTMQLS